MLRQSNSSIQFQYQYTYYYFAATWLRDHIDEPAIVLTIERLANSLHLEGNSKLLLFLVHLSKNPIILQTILASARRFYQHVEPVTFEESNRGLLGIPMTVTPVMLNEPNVEKNRERELRFRDAIEETEVHPEAGYASQHALDPVDLSNPMETYAASREVIKIMGQILRNFPSLRAADKKSLLSECMMLAFKSTASTFHDLHVLEQDIHDQLVDLFQGRNSATTIREAEQEARGFLKMIVELFALSMILSVERAVNAVHLVPVYEEISKQMNTASAQLVHASILLDQRSDFPEHLIKEVSGKLKQFPFAQTMLSHLVVLHFSRVHVSDSVIQRVCSELGIQYNRKLQVSSRRPRYSSTSNKRHY